MSRQQARGNGRVGSRGFAAAVSGAAALVLGLTVVSVPVPYVVDIPGPTYNTLGGTGGKEVISVSGRDSYDAGGNLDITTVYTLGGPASDVGLLELARSWFNPTLAILPEEVVYPPDVTREQVAEQNAALMQDSEGTAVAAALGELGIGYAQSLEVAAILRDSPSAGRLREGDRLVSVGGRAVRSLSDVQDVLAAGDGAPVAVVVQRDGTEVTETVTPARGDDRWLLGVGISYSFDFPLDVQFELGNVGGPSAGMMFALGVVDKLTPGDLTGGKHVAGTGSISPDGEVGSIGSIAQKMHGARSSGATLFLAPEANCDQVVGHIPEGLAVVSVATLADARAAVEGYARGEDPAGMPQCTGG